MRGILIVVAIVVIAVATYLVISAGGGGNETAPHQPSLNQGLHKDNKGNNVSPILTQQQKLSHLQHQNPSPVQQASPNQEESEFVKEYRAGVDFLSKGMLLEARQAFTTAYWGNVSDEIKQNIKQQMIAINAKIIPSKDEMRDAEVYEVKGGDVLEKIAKKFPDVTAGQIRLANGLQGDMIHPGQKLKILKGKFSIYIQKSKFLMQLLYDGSIVKEFKIAIGKDEETPTGKFTIGTKEKNPTWYMTDKKTGEKEAIKYGDSRNILGDRWMGFNKPFSSYGIHGTTDDASIGTRASAGCIRMHNKEVIELYEIIPSGAEVVIKD